MKWHQRWPDWWVLALAGTAWLVLLWRATGALPARHAAPLLDWSLMLAAMMLPLNREAIRAVAQRSLWRRRTLAMGLFVAAYLSPWLLAGALGSELVIGAQHATRPATVAALGLVTAIGWQLLPVKWVALSACHGTMPLAPAGWQANRDCLGYGWRVGVWCMASCWAMMLACALSGHPVPMLLGASAALVAERRAHRAHVRAVSTLALAAGAALVLVAPR